MMIVSNRLGSWQAWRRLLMSSNRKDRDSQMRCELPARPPLIETFLAKCRYFPRRASLGCTIVTWSSIALWSVAN